MTFPYFKHVMYVNIVCIELYQKPCITDSISLNSDSDGLIVARTGEKLMKY